jgi:iron complex outermembrane receptor protein
VKQLRTTSLLLMAGLMGALSTSTALASSSADTADQTVLEEIVITAEKRSSTVQKTPISITAISGRDLVEHGVSGVADAIQEVPGVSMASAGPGQTQYAIRGLSEDGGESPTVGFYLDETPITPPATSTNGKVSIDPGLYDLSRIEVLRGPQGTLYGAGAMGGTIKLVTNPPDPSKFYGTGESILSGTQGGGINYTQNAMVNLPFADGKAALRLVGTHAHTSGWIDRIVVSNFPLETNPVAGIYGVTRGNVALATATKVVKNSNEEDLNAVRGSLLMNPIENLSLTAAIFYQRISQDGPSVYDSDPGRSAHYQPFDIPEPYSDRFTIYSLTADYALDGIRATSATSYLSRLSSTIQDNSEATQNDLNLPAYSIADGGFGATPSWEYDRTKQLSQEIRITSNSSRALQWLTGLFYSKYDFFISLGSNFPQISTITGGATDRLFEVDSPLQIKQRAWFGNASYQFTDQIKLTAGLRYFSYEATASSASLGLLYTGSSVPNLASGSASDNGLNPMATVSYTPSDDVLMYATAAKGFREGNANFPIPTSGSAFALQCLADLEALGRTSAPLAFAPDTVWSYEIGAKSKLLDQRLTINGDVYYLKWSKVQQPVALSCGLSFTDNVADAQVKGAELEVALRLISKIRLTQTVGYASANFTTNAAESNIVAGQRLLDVPNWTVSSAIEYRTGQDDDHGFVVRLANSYVSSSEDISYGLNHLPSRDITALRLTEHRGDLSAALFVDNLLNRRVTYADVTGVSFTSPAFNRVSTNQPRTIGIDLNYRF